MAQTGEKETGFFNITASDLIGAYVSKEKNEAEAKSAALANQAANQSRNLNAAMIGSPSVAVDSGYADKAYGMPAFNKSWAIVGAVVLAVGGFLLAVRK